MSALSAYKTFGRRPVPGDSPPSVACDAMCGGLARWLRMMGVDATFDPAMDDASLVRRALEERRVVISSDAKLFERRAFHAGELAGLRLPVGLPLREQVAAVAAALELTPRFPRCTRCNGELQVVARADVADRVPARSLIWATEFHRCRACGRVYWNGTHWSRVSGALRALAPSRS